MLQVTQQQRDNALEALHVMWPSVPPENVIFNLKWWRLDFGPAPIQPPSCGTVACFGGWCAFWPAFQAQGVSTSENGAAIKNTDVADVFLFGDASIFSVRGGHPADGYASNKVTDHALVTNRLQWLIDNSEVTE